MLYSWFAGSLSYIEPAEDTQAISTLSVEDAAQLLGCDKSVIIIEEEM